MKRIVSLIPSGTEIVHALGMGKYQVGRSHECDFPLSIKSLTVCTGPKFAVVGSSQEINKGVQDVLREAVSVYDVYEDALNQLQPTHVVTQSLCEVCAVSLKDVQEAVARQLSSNLKIISLQSCSLAEVWNDIRFAADALGVPLEGRQLVESLEHRVDLITGKALTVSLRPSVACLEWLQPLMAAGNWVPELVELAGGTGLLGEAGRHSGYIDWEQFKEADPDIILLIPCGFDMGKTERELYCLTQRPEWRSLKAVVDGRVYLADGNQYFNRPGPRLVESLQILAEIIHPKLFSPSLRGVAWRSVHSV